MKNGQLLLGVALILVLFYFILQEQTTAIPPQREIVVVRRPGGVGAPFGYRRPTFSQTTLWTPKTTMDVVNLFLTIIYMFEIFALFLVVFILCFTLLPAAWSTIKKSSAFLKNNLITLAILFTFLTIVSDAYNWALGVYHRQTYMTAYQMAYRRTL